MLRHYTEDYDGFTNFKLDKSIDEGMEWNRISATYKDRESLHEILDELSKFRDFVESKGFKKEFSMKYSIIFDNPIRNNVVKDEEDSVVDDGDEDGFVTSFDHEDRIQVEEKLLYACIDYRFEENLLEFKEEEIKKFVKKQEDQIGVSHDNGETYTYYDDLLASEYGYGISFATLFEILKREGLKVEGNPWKYSYIDQNGNRYEFSYDFTKENPDDPDKDIWYYYLKNGEIVWMDYYFYNHLYVTKAEEITGLKLSIHRDEISD